jgi:four helix bundle protein
VERSRIQGYRDLDAWRVSMDLSVFVYKAVTCLPDSERFGLSAQMRRAGVSVPSNVAEGQACGEDGRYIHHLRTALGSLGELATQFEIARRLGMLSGPISGTAEEQLNRTGQVLHGLLRSRLKKRKLRATGSALLAGLTLWLLASPMLG